MEISIGSSSGGSSGLVTYANVAALPASAPDGTAVVTLDTDAIYIYSVGASAWRIANTHETALILSGTIAATNLSGTNTGDQTITLTSDVTGSGTGSFATTIAANAVTNAKAAQMPTLTFKGNNTGGTANALDLTVTQAQTMLGTSGTNTGDVTLAAVGSAPAAAGASLSGQALTLQPADGTRPGVLTAGTQTIGGSKTLGSAVADQQTIGAASSTAIHQVNGGLNCTTITTLNANRTIDTTTKDCIVFVSTSASPVTITLPAPTNGRLITITDIGGNTTSKAITIAQHASETILGVAGSYTFKTNFGSITLTSDGTNWYSANTSQVTQLATAGVGGVLGQLGVSNGGTGAASATTAPTANNWAGWDASKNMSANNFLEGYLTTATAAGTSTLVVGSAFQQFFTGATTQTVLLPVATTLTNGQQFQITNLSSGVVTVQTSGANTVQAMAANSVLLVTCVNTAGGTGTASWSWVYSPTAAGLPLTNPMNTGGDIIYGGAAGVPTRLANGSNLQYLKSTGGTTAPAWTTFTQPTTQRLLTTGTTVGYLFTVTSANATVGATFTNNSVTYTVINTIAAGTLLWCSGAGAPLASGTLTKSGGTGDATITFSLATPYATVTPTAGVVSWEFALVGGGGGGDGSGTTRGTSPTAGSASYLGANNSIANGGSPSVNQASSGGAGGSFTLGSFGYDGVAGGSGGPSINAVSSIGGFGGNSSRCGAGAGGQSGSAAFNAATNSGSGGGGGGSPSTAASAPGSAGGAGGTVWGFIASPTAQPYIIGTGGGAGAAGGGAGSAAGGAGAAGILVLIERYQ